MGGELSNAIIQGGTSEGAQRSARAFVNERSKARVVSGGGVGGFGSLFGTSSRSRSEQIRERKLNRLQSLVGGLESVASRIASGNVSKRQRTILMTRFNDLQRKVNELDGIVAGEGQEVGGLARISAAPAIAGRRGAVQPAELQIGSQADASSTVQRLREFQQSFRNARRQRRTTGQGALPRFSGLGSNQSNNSVTASATTGSLRDTRARGGFSSLVGTSSATSDSLLGNSSRSQSSGLRRSALGRGNTGGSLVNILA